MQHLFKTIAAANGRAFNKYQYVQRGLSANIKAVTGYSAKNSIRIKSSHPLIKLIHSINIPITQEGNRYYSNVDDISFEIANGVGFTSEISAGKTFADTLFAEVAGEVYLSMTGERPKLNHVGRLENWKRVESMKVLYTDDNNLNLDIPQGLTTSTVGGWRVISIDIPLFALQYREWMYEQLEKPVDIRENLSQFLYKYPLTNMLESQLQHSLFNRLRNNDNGVSNTDSTLRTVVPIINFSDKLNDSHEDFLQWVYRDRSSWDEILDTIMLTENVTLRDGLPKLNVVNTRQVYWLVILVYLPFIEWLVNTHLLNDRSTNKQYINSLRKKIRRIRSDRSTSVAPTPELAVEIKQRLENVLILLG